jgi:hypothetical protein
VGSDKPDGTCFGAAVARDSIASPTTLTTLGMGLAPVVMITFRPASIDETVFATPAADRDEEEGG